jgi:glycosyltransferase involved in cell wall biosynthesis
MNAKTKKLSIVFLDFDDIKNPLLGAGQAKATVEVGKCLVQSGHTVTVVSSRYPGYENRRENGINYTHIGAGTGNIKFNNFAYFFALPRAVAKLKADIIVECFTAPISTMFSPLFTRIPVVGLPTMFEAKSFADKYHIPFDVIERLGAKYYRYFMPYNQSEDKRMRTLNPKIESRIIPEGVGEEFFNIIQKKPKFILYLGRLDIHQKGIDLLLEAYAKVRKTIPFPLVIAGNGPDEARIQTLIVKYNLDGHVTLAGPAFGEKKDKLLEEAQCVAFPSRHEGFSLFSLEALASGLPIVGFNIDGLQFANAQVALKAKPYDTDAYGKCLVELCNPNLRSTMSENCRTLAKSYTWKKVAGKMESFFFDILEREAMHAN